MAQTFLQQYGYRRLQTMKDMTMTMSTTDTRRHRQYRIAVVGEYPSLPGEGVDAYASYSYSLRASSLNLGIRDTS